MVAFVFGHQTRVAYLVVYSDRLGSIVPDLFLFHPRATRPLGNGQALRPRLAIFELLSETS